MVNLPCSRISSVRHYTPGEGAQVRTKSTTWGFSTSIATRNQHPISPAQYMSDNFAVACRNRQRLMVGIYKLHAGTFEQIERYFLSFFTPLIELSPTKDQVSGKFPHTVIDPTTSYINIHDFGPTGKSKCRKL